MYLISTQENEGGMVSIPVYQ